MGQLGEICLKSHCTAGWSKGQTFAGLTKTEQQRPGRARAVGRADRPRGARSACAGKARADAAYDAPYASQDEAQPTGTPIKLSQDLYWAKAQKENDFMGLCLARVWLTPTWVRERVMYHRCSQCFHTEDDHIRNGHGCLKCTIKCDEFTPKSSYYRRWRRQQQLERAAVGASPAPGAGLGNGSSSRP